MNDLIKITEREGRRAVNARDLHLFLESKQQFADWIKSRIDKYDLVEGQDFQVFHNSMNNPNGGRPQVEYALSIDAAKELSMVEGNEKGKQARKYFIECEKIAKGEMQLPKTFAEALQLAANQAKELEEKNKQLEFKDTIISEYEPKANYYDIILSSKDAINISIIAKDYGLSAKTMNKKLHDLGVIYKSGDTWLPYQKYSSQGYTKTTTIAYNDGDGSAVHSKWTQKGRLFLYDLLKNNGLLPLVEQ